MVTSPSYNPTLLGQSSGKHLESLGSMLSLLWEHLFTIHPPTHPGPHLHLYKEKLQPPPQLRLFAETVLLRFGTATQNAGVPTEFELQINDE